MPRTNFVEADQSVIFCADTAAELAETPVTTSGGHEYPDGTLGFLSGPRRFLVLDRESVAAIDNVNVIDANTGVSAGRWIVNKNILANSSAFYVNSVTGNDNNDGLTALTAIETPQEFTARLQDVVFRQNTTFYFSGDFSTSDIVIPCSAIEGAQLAVVGALTLIHTGSLSGVQAMNVAGAADLLLTDAALPTSWTVDCNIDAAAARGAQLIRIVDVNGDTVMAGFGLEDLGADTCACGQFVSTTDDPFQNPSTQLEVVPSINDVYRVEQLTRIGDIIVQKPGTDVIVQWADVRSVGARPLKLACAAANRGITGRMTSYGSDVFVEGTGCLTHYVVCFQVGSSGIMVFEMNGYGIVLRGPSGASSTFRIFGCGGIGFPGNLVLQSCGIVLDNGTAVGFANILMRGLTAGIPGVSAQTNSRFKFANIAAPVAAVCADVGIQLGAGCIAVLSGGVAGSFTLGASRICGALIPNAKLGAASYDIVHLSGVILENGIGSARVVDFVSTTAARPTVGVSAGSRGFDTTLDRPIWRNAANTQWILADGTIV